MSIESERMFVEACRFHDIGKLLFPKDLLSKKKPLEANERIIIREHPVLGEQMASELLSWREPRMLTIIRSHHERWDGTGYPDGLRGKQIPIWARICAVIDAYDAMVHSRSYNRVKSIDEAKDELREQSGKQFDGACVDLFLSISNASSHPSKSLTLM